MASASSATLAATAATPRQQTTVTLPARAAFYYPWFPETWTVNGAHVFYRPTLGYYNSDHASVAEEHIRALDYARVDVGIASWWGAGTHKEALRIPLLLNRTAVLGSPLTWTLYYEKEGQGNPTVEELQSDLEYVSTNYAASPGYAYVNGKPVIFVYNEGDTTCEVASRWQQAAAEAWYVVLKVFSSYRTCDDQPDSWHQYGPARAERPESGYSFVISPGFWRADEATPRLARDLVRWRQNIRNMIASQAPWQLITTFNEWGEGTAVESAEEWVSSSGYGEYVDALHNDGQVPTAVALQAASAARTQTGVLLRWRTASESRQLGFNLYRGWNGKRVKLNRAVIPSTFAGTAVGDGYSWFDRRAPRKGALRYWLEEISLSGARSWHGPIVVS